MEVNTLLATCKKCQHYNGGEGDKRHCLKCWVWADVGRERPKSPPMALWPKEIIENVSAPSNMVSVYEMLTKIPLKEATIFVQYFVLRASHRELAEFWDMTERNIRRITKRVKKFLLQHNERVELYGGKQ